MGIQELRDKYGNKKGCQLVNDAVRAEILCGNEILDAFYLAPQVCRATSPEKREVAERICNLLFSARNKMIEEIAQKYNLTLKGGKT